MQSYKTERTFKLKIGTRAMILSLLAERLLPTLSQKETNTENIMNYPKRGESFRLELWFKTEEQTRQAFADLLSGKKSLKDFRENAERPHYLDLI